MIEMNSEKQAFPNNVFENKLSALVLGVGGAGGRIVNALSRTACEGLEYLVLDSDVQSLGQITHCKAIQIGKKILRGFGTGASREVAQSIAEAEKEALRQLVGGHSLLFLIAGFGGGLGGGVAPVIAALAAEEGVFVIAISIFPFICEGTDRSMRATRSQEEMTANAHLHISLPNELLALQANENANFIELYESSNRMISDAVEGLWLSFFHPGPMALDLGLLRSSFGFNEGKCLGSLAVASATGESKSRVESLWETLLAHPWLKAGSLLRGAGTVLALFIGKEGFSLTDAESFQRRIASENPGAKIMLGACTPPKYDSDELRIVLITHPKRTVRDEEKTVPINEEKDMLSLNEVSSEMLEKKRPPTRNVPPPPALTNSQIDILKSQMPSGGRSKRGYNDPNQGVLDLKITSVGRFDQCEKTYYKNQPIDVPTYSRVGYELK